MTRFAMNDLGNVSVILGLQVCCDHIADTLGVIQLNYSKGGEYLAAANPSTRQRPI